MSNQRQTQILLGRRKDPSRTPGSAPASPAERSQDLSPPPAPSPPPTPTLPTGGCTLPSPLTPTAPSCPFHLGLFCAEMSPQDKEHGPPPTSKAATLALLGSGVPPPATRGSCPPAGGGAGWPGPSKSREQGQASGPQARARTQEAGLLPAPRQGSCSGPARGALVAAWAGLWGLTVSQEQGIQRAEGQKGRMGERKRGWRRSFRGALEPPRPPPRDTGPSERGKQTPPSDLLEAVGRLLSSPGMESTLCSSAQSNSRKKSGSHQLRCFGT